DRQVLARVAAVLERHAVGGGELQVGEALLGFLGQRQGARETRAVERREAREAGAAPRGDFFRRAVAREEALLVVGVAGHEGGDAPRDARVAGERRVLGARELEAGFQRRQRERRRPGAEAVEEERLAGEHRREAYVAAARSATSCSRFGSISSPRMSASGA